MDHEQPVDDFTMALAATAELCGTQLSKPAAKMLRQDLAQYPEALILGALKRCRKELKGKLTVHEILSRIDDGRPGADEAWTLLAWDEELTAVLPKEADEAQGIVRPTYMSGDKTGARFAFRDVYTRLVNEARERNEPVRWIVSEGYDKQAKSGTIRDAVDRGRISPQMAQRLLPPGSEPVERTAIPADVKKQIASIGNVPLKPKLKIEGVPSAKRADLEAELSHVGQRVKDAPSPEQVDAELRKMAEKN